MAASKERRRGPDEQLGKALGGVDPQQLGPVDEDKLLGKRISGVVAPKLEHGTDSTKQVLASIESIRVTDFTDTSIAVDFLGGKPEGCRQFGRFIADALDKPGHRARTVLVNPVSSFEEAETVEQLERKLKFVQALNVEKK